MKLEACKLCYHSGGMRGPYYFTTEKVDLEVSQSGKEQGVKGKIGPFLKVGEIYLTKQQAMRLAVAIYEEVTKME